MLGYGGYIQLVKWGVTVACRVGVQRTHRCFSVSSNATYIRLLHGLSLR